MTQLTNNHFFTPSQMMEKAEQYAISKVSKTNAMLLGLSIMAGAFIALAFVFYLTVTTGSSDAWGISRLLGGVVFSVGLILVVLCGGELFTSSVLSIIALANKQITLAQMLKAWGKVYLGNFIGAALLLLLVVGAGLYQLSDGQWGINALHVAQHKLHHTPVQAFSLGVLCNVMVCLAVWLTFSSANALTKAAMMVMPVALFVSTGFEHCIANMFMVPLGIAIKTLAPPAFWTQLGVTQSAFSDLTFINFITANLIPVTLGNIFGGAVLVGLSNWFIYNNGQAKNNNLTLISSTKSQIIKKENTMKQSQLIKDVMQTNHIVFSADTHISVALDTLLEAHISGAPVCDVKGDLVGFLSIHDILVNLWCKDYEATPNQKVVELMNRDIVAIDAQDSVERVLEFMCIDKEKLYPTTSFGIATQLTTLPLEERAKKVRISKPHILPVVDNGKLVGVISRLELMSAFRPAFGKHINDVVNNEQPQQIA